MKETLPFTTRVYNSHDPPCLFHNHSLESSLAQFEHDEPASAQQIAFLQSPCVRLSRHSSIVQLYRACFDGFAGLCCGREAWHTISMANGNRETDENTHF